MRNDDLRAEMVRAHIPARVINRISREIRKADYEKTPEENTETKGRSRGKWETD